MIPVANAREPGRTAAARKRFRALAFEVKLPVPIEALALPDLLDGDVVGVWKQVGSPERNILPAQRNPPERIDVQPLKRPDARIAYPHWHRPIQMRIERVQRLDMSVVVPRQKFARDHLVDADMLHPEVNRRLELSLNLFLADDRYDDSRRRLELLAHGQRRANIVDRVSPPLLRIARRSSSMRRTDDR